MLAAATSRGQGNELSLSEYTKGARTSGISYNGGVSLSTGSEKALEIFNPSSLAVSLNAYSIRHYSSGEATVTEEEKLVRTTGASVLDSGAAIVYTDGESTITAITSKANQLGDFPVATPGPNTLVRGGVACHNGDDALGLVRWTGGMAGADLSVLVDISDVIGFRPVPAGGGMAPQRYQPSRPARP